MLHQFLRTDRLDDFRINAAFPLQEPEDDAFARGGAAPLAFAPAAEIGLIEFDLSFQFPRFQLGHMIQRFAHAVIDAGDDFHVQAQILAQPIGGLQLIEALQDPDLAAHPPEAFAFPTAPTFHIAAAGVQDLKGAAENVLATAQKVGRTTKNRMSSCNHAGFLPHIGYETP